MNQVPDSLLAFQRMFPDDDACAAWLIEMRWPDGFRVSRVRPRQGMGAARQSPHLRVRRLPPADLRDSRDDSARQQAAAHRLVLGRLLDGDPFQRHLRPATPEATRHRLVPKCLAARPQAAYGDGQSRAQPVVGLGRNRRGQPSLPYQERSPRRRAGAQPRRQDADRRRHRTGGWNHPGAACGWPKSPPTALPTSAASSKPPPIPTPSPKPTAGPAMSAFLRIAMTSISSARPPLISSFPGSTRSSPTSRLGARRLPRAAPQTSASLPRRVRLSLQPTKNPPRRLPLSLRSRRQSKTPYLQHVDQTGAMCISGLPGMGRVEATVLHSALELHHASRTVSRREA